MNSPIEEMSLEKVMKNVIHLTRDFLPTQSSLSPQLDDPLLRGLEFFFVRPPVDFLLPICDLESLKEHCEVLSMVNYSNVWHNGKMTNIRNGDRFVYIAADDVSKISDHLDIGEYRAYVFKPKAVTMCKRCQKEGHCASDDSCPAKAPEWPSHMVHPVLLQQSKQLL